MAQQAFAIVRRWPGERPSITKGRLNWTGVLQPSPFSPRYVVRLKYSLGKPPAVHVLAPQLDPGHRDRLPHVYSGDRLCLYTPGEWFASMFLADTIVPWASEWLYHYELWKATDQWSGGGDVYSPSDDDDGFPIAS